MRVDCVGLSSINREELLRMANARHSDHAGRSVHGASQPEDSYVFDYYDFLRHAFPAQVTVPKAITPTMMEVVVYAQVAATVILSVSIFALGFAMVTTLLVTILHTILTRRYLHRMAAAQKGATPRETFLKKSIWLHRIEHLDKIGYPAPTRWRMSQLLRLEWRQLVRALRGPQLDAEAADASRRATE